MNTAGAETRQDNRPIRLPGVQADLRQRRVQAAAEDGLEGWRGSRSRRGRNNRTGQQVSCSFNHHHRGHLGVTLAHSLHQRHLCVMLAHSLHHHRRHLCGRCS